MRAKQLAITAAVLLIILTFMGTINNSSFAEGLGMAVGALILPLFNAHLFTKYIDSKLIKDNVQISMLIIGILSLFINSALVFLIIVGAIGFSHFSSKKAKKTEAK